MYCKPISFSIAFTDQEESIIGPALENYIKKMATRDFFMDVYCDGDVIIVLNIIKRMRNNNTVELDKSELMTLIGVLQDQNKVTDECAQIIHALENMVGHSFST